jgi:hypothetical protein
MRRPGPRWAVAPEKRKEYFPCYDAEVPTPPLLATRRIKRYGRHKIKLSACQLEASRGNATPSLGLISKQTVAVPLICVIFTKSRWKTVRLASFVQLHRSHDVTACRSDKFARCSRCGNTAFRVKKILLTFLPVSERFTQRFTLAFLCFEYPLPIL